MASRDRRIEVSASDFKNSWHEFLDLVARGRREVVITRYGKPIARLTSLDDSEEPGVFGFMTGSVSTHGDIVGPLGDVWEADD